MTEETVSPESAEAAESGESTPGERTPIALRYQGMSQVVDEASGGARVALFGNTYRSPVQLDGVIKDPLRVREALSVLYEVVRSDHRYVPRDRTAYMAYQRQQSKAGSANAFEAQRQYFDWLSRNDPNAWLLLDPIITAHPDELLLEVFSKDEGSYARLGIDWSALELAGQPTYGTTNVDFSNDLFSGFQRMRSYRTTRLAVAPDALRVQTEGAPEVLEKQINVPNTWLRGFLQVQSSATLPLTSFSMAPIDLYNVLRHLRLHADQKKGGRAIRVELMPGERPRLVLEPWEVVIPTTGAIYNGRVAQVVRIWGRRRLMMLRRLLPFVDSVDVHLLGTGLPHFYVLRCGAITFTMGLTGFTSSNWSQALSLDTLLPRTERSSDDLKAVLDHLKGTWVASVAQIATALGFDAARARRALQVGCQNGQLMYDIASEVYRLRPVTDTIDLEKLAFRNERERQAYDVLHGKGGKVELESENMLVGVGVQYVGKVHIDADRREYRCELTIDEEGRVKRADCTSPFFRKHQLKEGPSAPLVALRLLIAQQQQARAAERGAGSITYETRTYVKRHDSGEDVYQVALDQRRLKVRWGLRSQERLRTQSLLFSSVDDAREAYFARIQSLERKGFMDATAH